MGIHLTQVSKSDVFQKSTPTVRTYYPADLLQDALLRGVDSDTLGDDTLYLGMSFLVALRDASSDLVFAYQDNGLHHVGLAAPLKYTSRWSRLGDEIAALLGASIAEEADGQLGIPVENAHWTHALSTSLQGQQWRYVYDPTAPGGKNMLDVFMVVDIDTAWVDRGHDPASVTGTWELPGDLLSRHYGALINLDKRSVAILHDIVGRKGHPAPPRQPYQN